MAASSLPLILLAMILSLIYAIATISTIAKAVMGLDLSLCAVFVGNYMKALWLGPLAHHQLAQLSFGLSVSSYLIYRTPFLEQRNTQLERALHEDPHGYDMLELERYRQLSDDLAAENQTLKSYIKARPNKQVHIDLAASRRRNAAITRQNIGLKTQIKRFEREETERTSCSVQRLMNYLGEQVQEKNFAQLEADLTVANKRIDELCYLLATLDPSGVWTDVCRAQGGRAEAQAASKTLWQDNQELRAQLASRDSEIERLVAELAGRDGEIRRLKEDHMDWQRQFELRFYKKLVLRYGDKPSMLKIMWLQAKNQYLVKELKRFTGLYRAECKSRRNWQASWHKLVFDTSDTEDEEEGSTSL